MKAAGIEPLTPVEFPQLVRDLEGARLTRAGLGYGGELRLSLDVGPKERWSFGGRTSRWLVVDNHEIVSRDTDGVDTAAPALERLVGSQVRSIRLREKDLALSIKAAGWLLLVLPNKPKSARGEPDLWELFSPHGWWLSVRRNGAMIVIPDDASPPAVEEAYHRRSRKRA